MLVHLAITVVLSSFCYGKSLSGNDQTAKVKQLEAPKACDGHSDLLFLFLVHSNPRDVARRNLIRQTWGSVRELPGGRSRVVFVVGKEDPAPDSQINSARNHGKVEHGRARSIGGKGSKQELLGTAVDADQKSTEDLRTTPDDGLRTEAQEFGDILQGDFVDTSANSSLKHLLGLSWLVEESGCQPVFAVTSKDDVFVEIFHLAKFVEAIYNNKPGKSLLVCDVLPTSPSSPLSSTAPDWQSGSFQVNNHDKDNQNKKSPRIDSHDGGTGELDSSPGGAGNVAVYSQHCSDTAFLMTPDLAENLLEIAKKMPPKMKWSESGSRYVTGRLRSALGISPFYLNLRYTQDPQAGLRWVRARNTLPLPYLFASPGKSQGKMGMKNSGDKMPWEELYRKLWKKTVRVHQKRDSSTD